MNLVARITIKEGYDRLSQDLANFTNGDMTSSYLLQCVRNFGKVVHAHYVPETLWKIYNDIERATTETNKATLRFEFALLKQNNYRS
jgi:hypothetical protein